MPRTRSAKAAPAPVTALRADLVDREPNAMHERLADYITEQTGYEADVKTVQLVTTLRRAFQKTDEHQSELQARKAAKAAATKPTRTRKTAAAKQEANATPDESAKPTRRGRRTAAAEVAAPAKTTRRTRKAAASADEPF